ncbi:hypothetical protein [Halobacterium noricense]|uniref:hypothetical protein n=1 Tax=Halobacterium noricense TaxID=223182 RepID=UPI001E42A215|nr:hypothetical protein [Halobacterium noricense]UHH24929.1 hypothetical protein LT974_13195 [Halobacterium noricense]
MACTNCGDGGDVEGYTVRFTQGGTEPTEVELVLCATCAEEFSAESGIELR